MRTSTKLLLSVAACTTLANAAYHPEVQFEAPKDTSDFNGVELKSKLDLTFNYQLLEHDFTRTGKTVQEIQSGMILPTADLDFDAKVMKGFNTKLEVMLSSHHHNETYVKGGYATIDNLDFITPGFLQGLMNDLTVKVGVDDINFGDYHYRRTDNADVFRNPFILNTGVEAYMQAGFVELLYRIPAANMFVMYGITNGQANPDDTKAGDGKGAEAHYFKIGYDNQAATRLRVTESYYTVSDTTKNSFYSGDKAGTVPREIFNDTTSATTTGTSGNDFGSLWNPLAIFTTKFDFSVSSTNLFVKAGGTEFFGLVELLSAEDATKTMDMVHYSVDAVQRFGENERFYAAVRYENATTDVKNDTVDNEMTQIQATLGWFLSPNAMMKVEYVKQERKGFATTGDLNTAVYDNGEASFDGMMVSAALSF